MTRKKKAESEQANKDISRLFRAIALECERELQRRGRTTGITALKQTVKEENKNAIR